MKNGLRRYGESRVDVLHRRQIFSAFRAAAIFVVRAGNDARPFLSERKGHRFLVPTDRYVALWNVISECIQAEIARRPPSA